MQVQGVANRESHKSDRRHPHTIATGKAVRHTGAQPCCGPCDLLLCTKCKPLSYYPLILPHAYCPQRLHLRNAPIEMHGSQGKLHHRRSGLLYRLAPATTVPFSLVPPYFLLHHHSCMPHDWHSIIASKAGHAHCPLYLPKSKGPPTAQHNLNADYLEGTCCASFGIVNAIY